MHFGTLHFAYFFAVVLTLSWALRRWPLGHKLVLLVASYFFYARLSLWLMALLFGSSLVNYCLGEVMVRTRLARWRDVALGTALAANLGLLGLFKYYGFFRETVAEAAELFTLTSHLPVLELVLPLGISFFTFQGIAYVVDLYRGRGMLAASLIDFLLFIAFFPKLLTGPICRSRDLLPQIANGPPPRVPELSRAVALITSGMFKKLVLATILGTRLVDSGFLAPENYSGVSLWMAAYAYSIQLYCDFSGYTDMARGAALLLGYRLPENFNGPYAATDLGLFWKRWHATFSSWLREYVYFPLGGSRGSLLRTSFNLLVTFTLCGLWHGATWGYILWGGLHGVFLSVHKMIRNTRRKLGLMGREPIWYLAAGWFLTFHVVVLSRISFRAGDLETAAAFFSRMVMFAPGPNGVDSWVILACSVGMLLNFAGRTIRQQFVRAHDWLPKRYAPALWAAIVIVLLALKPDDVAPYIYFQF